MFLNEKKIPLLLLDLQVAGVLVVVEAAFGLVVVVDMLVDPD